jgi:medium-chain acyl-[acyl-carrier-protein] hydrolase
MNRWLQLSSAADAVARVLCFHRAGGNARDFYSWGEVLSDEVQVCAVQLPGRLDRFREPVLQTIEPIANEVANLAAGLDELPLVLFGDCMGALLAFEVARTMRRDKGLLPAALIVASYAPPDQLRTGPQYNSAPPEEFRGRLFEVGGVPHHVLQDDELFKLLLPTLRADFAVFENYCYTPEAPLAVDTHAIVGVEDPYVPESVLAGWRRHNEGEFTLRKFAGGHFFLRDNREVLDYIKAVALDAAGLDEP